MEGSSINQLFPENNKIVLSNNQSHTYKCLIVADGVFSSVSRALQLPPLPKALCIQNSIKRELCPTQLKQIQELQLYFGDIQLGYSWIVPYKTEITIGSGMFISKSNYSDLLKKHQMLCEKIGLPSSSKKNGAFIPIGGAAFQLEQPYKNIAIVGDAAGLVNPLTGEGIYNALLSGYFAGKSYLQNPTKFSQTYLSFLRPIISQISEQERLIPQMYNQFLFENAFLQFKDYPQYWGEIFDDVFSSEKRSYNSLLMELQQLLR